MSKINRRSSVGRKMYLFVILSVMTVALGTAAISYFISAGQIDGYFKRLTLNSASNFASIVDPDYLAKLKKTAESEDFQQLRNKAEEEDDELAIERRLREEGLWDGYVENRDKLVSYLRNMDDVKYLYVVVLGDKNADRDMYLLDDYENPLYETGYYEEREKELLGLDPSREIEPTISHGEWGWLCSAYSPVYDNNGKIICHVGCDVDMERIMAERRSYLVYSLISSFLFTAFVLILAILFSNKVIVDPLRTLTREASRFKPNENSNYKDANVIELELKSRDEISDIYEAIRSMQMNIIDYLNDLSTMQKDNQRYVSSLKKAENAIKDKEQQLGQMSKEAYRDPLTRVGNKAAYTRKTEELSNEISEGNAEFAIVMADLNDLKKINDLYGHRSGDTYIKGCCHIICEIYKHSPVYRIGGDEFIVLLQGDDYANRYALIDKAKEMFAQSSSDEDVLPVNRFSAALGMAEFAADDNTVELVFKRADKDMYADKRKYKESHGSYR